MAVMQKRTSQPVLQVRTLQSALLDLVRTPLVPSVCSWTGGILLDGLVSFPNGILFLSTILVLCLLPLLWSIRWLRSITLVAFCCLLGACRHSIALPLHDPHSLMHIPYGTNLRITGVVSSEPTFQGTMRTLRVAANRVSIEDAPWQPCTGNVLVQVPGLAIEDNYGANYGDTITLRGILRPPPPKSPPDTIASMSFPRITVKSNGSSNIIAILYHLRVLLAEAITRFLPQPQAALLIALLLSLRTPALAPLVPAFNVTGLAHLIAPSGFKVTLLAGMITRLGSNIFRSQSSTRYLLPAQKRGGWQRWLNTGLTVSGIILYTLLSGAGPAALRAGMMGILLVMAPRLGRTYHVYSAMACSALLMTLVDPFLLWDAGFQLSFMGTLGIVLLTPMFQRLLRPVLYLPLGHVISEMMAVTLAAQLATLPFFAVTFQTIPLIAPIANLLTVPLLSTMLLLGILLATSGLLFAPLALLISWLAWPILWYVTTVTLFCAKVPGSYLPMPSVDSSIIACYYLLSGTCLFLIFTAYPHLPFDQPARHAPGHILSPTRLLWLRTAAVGLVLLGTLICILSTQLSSPATTITFLNTTSARHGGAGGPILVRTTDHKTVLIDGGADAASLARELDSRLPPWQHSLDLLMLTSPRPDHMDALLDLSNRYTIDTAIDAGMLHPSTTYARWRRIIEQRHVHYVAVTGGTSIRIGAFVTLEVLWPPPLLHKGTNEVRDNSIILYITIGSLHLLLLGAATESTYALTGLTHYLDVYTHNIDIVQVGEEIDKPFPGTLQQVVQQAHPSYVISTTAPENGHSTGNGHPAAMSLCSTTVRCQWLRIAEVGTLQIVANSESFFIETG